MAARPGIAALILALTAGAGAAQQGAPAAAPSQVAGPSEAPRPSEIIVRPPAAPAPGEGAAIGAATAPALVVETPAPGPDAPPATAGIMTIDPEAVFTHSLWGQRVQADLERQSREIAAENERLASQFAAEEQELTNLRSALPPDEFRRRADDFDRRVVEVRRQRDAVGRALQDRLESERAAFFRAALPVLAELMQERGAVVVLDQRAIFVSARSADVTEALIALLDDRIGAGPEGDAGTPDGAAPSGGAAQDAPDEEGEAQGAPVSAAPPADPPTSP